MDSQRSKCPHLAACLSCATWLNAWARDWSTPYVKPEFHSNDARELNHGATPVITKEQMRNYLEKVRGECMSFLDGLTDETVFAQEEGFGRTFTSGRSHCRSDKPCAIPFRHYSCSDKARDRRISKMEGITCLLTKHTFLQNLHHLYC